MHANQAITSNVRSITQSRCAKWSAKCNTGVNLARRLVTSHDVRGNNQSLTLVTVIILFHVKHKYQRETALKGVGKK